MDDDDEELLNTPSFKDGIDAAAEAKYRRDGASFIVDVSKKLNLRCETFATAVVFFHRFYMIHSFHIFKPYVTAACCLMLAGKVEETPKKVSHIARCARELLSPIKFNQFGSNPTETIISFERVLLKTIKFDFQVAHPYSFLAKFAGRVKGANEEVMQKTVQMAWVFINDSLVTTLCLQWEPEIIACAVFYLAARFSKLSIDDWINKRPGKKWWECFVEGMTTEVLQDICHSILDLYPSEGSTQNPSKPTSSSLMQ